VRRFAECVPKNVGNITQSIVNDVQTLARHVQMFVINTISQLLKAREPKMRVSKKVI
jgi:hypothetical protein